MAETTYAPKDGNRYRTFDALDWLARLVTHIPNKGEQMIRYYGYYSNKSRGLRKKAGMDDAVPALIDAKMAPKEFRKNWARLIQKIHQVDPLLCPKCRDPKKVIGFIEDGEIIEKILRYLGLWETRSNDPPKSSNKPLTNRKGELTCDIAYSQLPPIDYWTQ